MTSPTRSIELLAFFGIIPPLREWPGRPAGGASGAGRCAPDVAAGFQRIQCAAGRDARTAVRVRAPLRRGRQHAAWRSSFTARASSRRPCSLSRTRWSRSRRSSPTRRPRPTGSRCPTAFTSVGCARGRARVASRRSRRPKLTTGRDAELEFVRARNAQQAVGDRAHVTVAPRVDSRTSTEADELIVVPQGPDLETKLRTLRDAARRWESAGVSSRPRRLSRGWMSASRPRKSRYASSGSFEPPTPSSRCAETVAVGPRHTAVLLEPVDRVGIQHLAPDVGVVARVVARPRRCARSRCSSSAGARRGCRARSLAIASASNAATSVTSVS